MIRNVNQSDAEALCAIYNHYVSNTVVTFEEMPVTTAEMERRIDAVTSGYPWLVFEEGGTAAGYAYASTWRERSAFRYSAESSVYVSVDCTGRGIGTRLYEALLSQLREQEIRCVIAGITLPNPPSVKLHDKLGFKKAAHFTTVGRKFDRWIDVGFWELILAE